MTNFDDDDDDFARLRGVRSGRVTQPAPPTPADPPEWDEATDDDW